MAYYVLLLKPNCRAKLMLRVLLVLLMVFFDIYEAVVLLFGGGAFCFVTRVLLKVLERLS